MTARAKLSVKEAAEVVGVKPSSWRGMVARGQRPAPDGHSEPCGCPWWFDTTIRKDAAKRESRRKPVAVVDEDVITYDGLHSVCMIPGCGCDGYAHA